MNYYLWSHFILRPNFPYIGYRDIEYGHAEYVLYKY